MQSNEAGNARASLPVVQGLLRDLILTVTRLQARLRDISCNQLVDIAQSVSDVQIVHDQCARLRESVLLVMDFGKQ